MERNTGLFDPITRTCIIVTIHGVFFDVPYIGTFDNCHDMDNTIDKNFANKLKTTGVLARINSQPVDQYVFVYPEHVGGEVIITCRGR